MYGGVEDGGGDPASYPIIETMRYKMSKIANQMKAALKSNEEAPFKLIGATAASASDYARNSARQPAIDVEFTTVENAPAVPQANSISPALQVPPASNPPILGPQDMMQKQTKALSVLNNNHTAKQTRARQMKEEQFQMLLRQSYYELSAAIIRPLVNRPSATGEFPFHLLPKGLADDVRRIRNATGWDSFSTLVTILGSLSIALWGRFTVRLDNGWDEPVVTYLCVASPSGTMKSFFVKTLKAPILAFRDEMQETFDMVGAEAEEASELMRGAIKKNQRKQIKQLVDTHADDLDAILTECQKIAESTVAAKKKLDAMRAGRPTILVDNITPKKILHVMKDNGDVGNIFEAEIGYLEDIVKERTLGARLFLKAHCMEDFSYDSCRAEVRLLLTALNIIYVIQPEALRKIYMNHELANFGVTPRFDIHFASEPHLSGLNEYDEAVLRRYSDKILSHLRRNYTQEQPRPISYITATPEAKDVLMGYKLRAHNQATSGAYKYIASYIQKLPGKAARWAALVHSYMNEHPESVPISADTMQIGIAIAEHLAGHADYAFRGDGLQAYDLAQRILAWIKERGQYEFSPREFQRGPGSRLKMGTVEGALKLLERHNIIRIHHKPYGGLHCLVHPHIWSI
jgi:hypothetical protein